MKPIITPEEKAEFLTFIGDTTRDSVEMALDALIRDGILDGDHMSRILDQFPGIYSEIEEFVAGLVVRIAHNTQKRTELVRTKKELVLDADDGSRTIGEHIDFFINFHEAQLSDLSTPGAPTGVQKIETHKLVQPGTLEQIYGGLGSLDKLCLSQGQILQFENQYSERFPVEGSGIFFLFKIGKEYFVTRRYRCSNELLSTFLHPFTDKSVWELHNEPLFVVPVPEPAIG